MTWQWVSPKRLRLQSAPPGTHPVLRGERVASSCLIHRELRHREFLIKKIVLFGCCVFIYDDAAFEFQSFFAVCFFLTVQLKAALWRFKAQISLSGTCRKKALFFPPFRHMQTSDRMKCHRFIWGYSELSQLCQLFSGPILLSL